MFDFLQVPKFHTFHPLLFMLAYFQQKRKMRKTSEDTQGARREVVSLLQHEQKQKLVCFILLMVSGTAETLKSCKPTSCIHSSRFFTVSQQRSCLFLGGHDLQCPCSLSPLSLMICSLSLIADLNALNGLVNLSCQCMWLCQMFGLFNLHYLSVIVIR